MHQLPAFANMTMSVRRELCAVMVFAVVERAGTIVLNDGEEVSRSCFSFSYYTKHPRFHTVKVLFCYLKIKKEKEKNKGNIQVNQASLCSGFSEGFCLITHTFLKQ